MAQFGAQAWPDAGLDAYGTLAGAPTLFATVATAGPTMIVVANASPNKSEKPI
jgi:hypothetical protein